MTIIIIAIMILSSHPPRHNLIRNPPVLIWCDPQSGKEQCSSPRWWWSHPWCARGLLQNHCQWLPGGYRGWYYGGKVGMMIRTERWTKTKGWGKGMIMKDKEGTMSPVRSQNPRSKVSLVFPAHNQMMLSLEDVYKCWILTRFSQVAHENVAPCGSDLVGQIVKVIMIFQIIFITNYKGRSSERKNIFFRALPELPLFPPPIRATCTIFIGCKKWRFSAYYRTK